MTSTQNASLTDFGTQSRLLPASSNTFFVSVLLRRGALNVSWYGSSASALIVAVPSRAAAPTSPRSQRPFESGVSTAPTSGRNWRIASPCSSVYTVAELMPVGRGMNEPGPNLARATDVMAGVEAIT